MTTPRSYLFVPGDAPRKMEKAAAAKADAVILDLEDSVAAARKDQALRVTRDFLAARAIDRERPEYWVRINTATPAAALAELSALPLAPLRGIFYPKLAAGWQLARLGHWLDALEYRERAPLGQIQIIGIITETAGALVGEQAATLARGHPRLRGYTWGTEDLSAALGRAPLPGTTDAQRRLAEAAQTHCLLTAAAAGVDAIDGISADFRDHAALGRACDLARELGYVAKLAIHPAQLETIRAGLAPQTRAVEWARRVRALVRDNPESASLSLDGRMLDQPHFEAAARILARADGANADTTQKTRDE